MLQRLALFTASLAAALVIAGGLAIAGPGPTAPAVEQVASAREAPPVQVDTVYVTPEASPEQVTVTRVQTTPSRGDDEVEREGGDHGGDD